jgi:hypothetical protein
MEGMLHELPFPEFKAAAIPVMRIEHSARPPNLNKKAELP